MVHTSLQILHCSDLHLDKNFNIPNISRGIERKEDINRNFSEIVNFALNNKPDLFLITGDIFDRILPSNYARIFLTKKIRELKEKGIYVYMIGGNHDVPKIGRYSHLAIDILQHAGLATVFSRSDIIQKKVINVSGKSVCISGKSYFAQFEGQNPLKNEKIPIEGDYNILLLHGSLQGLNIFPAIPEMAVQNPFRADDIQKGINYLALGHFHNYFERAYNNCLICNPGSIEKLTWAEMDDEKMFAWAELSGSEGSVEFQKLDTRPMELQDLFLKKDMEDKLSEIIIEHLTKIQDPIKILRLNLKGLITQAQYAKMRINEIYRQCRDLFFHLEIQRKDLEVEGFGRIFIERIDNPVEAFTKRLDRLIVNTSDENKRKQLMQVKEVGIKYLETSQ